MLLTGSQTWLVLLKWEAFMWKVASVVIWCPLIQQAFCRIRNLNIIWLMPIMQLFINQLHLFAEPSVMSLMRSMSASTAPSLPLFSPEWSLPRDSFPSSIHFHPRTNFCVTLAQSIQQSNFQLSPKPNYFWGPFLQKAHYTREQKLKRAH